MKRADHCGKGRVTLKGRTPRSGSGQRKPDSKGSFDHYSFLQRMRRELWVPYHSNEATLTCCRRLCTSEHSLASTVGFPMGKGTGEAARVRQGSAASSRAAARCQTCAPPGSAVPDRSLREGRCPSRPKNSRSGAKRRAQSGLCGRPYLEFGAFDRC